jgi:hypothetical protein
MVSMMDWMIDWMIDWMMDWMIDWMMGPVRSTFLIRLLLISALLTSLHITLSQFGTHLSEGAYLIAQPGSYMSHLGNVNVGKSISVALSCLAWTLAMPC